MTESLPAFPELPSSPEAKLRWIAWGNEIARLERERLAEKMKPMDCAHKCGVGEEIAAAIRSQGEPT
jgi:hypothetical protein